MKRVICCQGCSQFWKKLEGKKEADASGPVEYVRVVYGHLVAPKICDDCGTDLPEGMRVACVSNYTAANPYFDWETQHVRRDFTEDDTRL